MANKYFALHNFGVIVKTQSMIQVNANPPPPPHRIGTYRSDYLQKKKSLTNFYTLTSNRCVKFTVFFNICAYLTSLKNQLFNDNNITLLYSMPNCRNFTPYFSFYERKYKVFLRLIAHQREYQAIMNQR